MPNSAIAPNVSAAPISARPSGSRRLRVLNTNASVSAINTTATTPSTRSCEVRLDCTPCVITGAPETT